MPGATASAVAVMKQLFLAGLAFGLVVAAGSASAADMPLKVPASLPAPAPNWTGCYIGGNGGVAWTNNDSTLEAIGGSPPGIPLGPAAGSAAAYGGQVGCDYQANSNWVVGLRGMWDATTVKSSIQGAVTAGGNTITSALNSETRAFGTAVARVGYSVTPALMFYGVGGVAFAENKYSQNIVTPVPPAFVTFQFTGNDTPTGWAAGAGAAWMLSPNWDIFVEYNYLGFGNRTVTTAGLAPLTNSVRQDVQTILAGLDFRFTNWTAGQFGVR